MKLNHLLIDLASTLYSWRRSNQTRWRAMVACSAQVRLLGFRSLYLNYQQLYLFGRIPTATETGGQPYSDTSPYKVGK